MSAQQAIQQSLWDESEREKPVMPSPIMSTESQEEYERRRVVEMAEKVHWRSMSRTEPLRCWPGVEIKEGEQEWRAFLEEAASGTVGLMVLALQSLLDPFYFGSINEATGLHQHPVEVISRIEERNRARMMQLAGLLGWPHISYWDANRTLVFGPGEEAWRKYFASGSFASITCAITALERRMRGEPDKSEKTKQTLRQQWHDEEDFNDYE
jgi:hypothetical protein